MYADSTAIVYSSDNTHNGNTTVNGELTVKGKLTLSQQGSGTSDILEYLDVTRLGNINNLIRYSDSGKPAIIASDGSTIGGVGFTTGALTGVTSINAGESDAKFSIDGNNIKLGYLTINATNDGIKFTDENRSNSFTIADVINIKSTTQTLKTGYHSEGNVKDTYTTLGEKLKVYDKRTVGSGDDASETSLDLVTIKGDLYVADNYSTIVKEADSKFYVKGSDGSLKAANGKFTVDADGKVQIEDELVISHAGSATEADPGKSATLNIDNLTAINKLIKVTEGVNSTVVYDTSGKPVITAGSGSTIGGVTISDGQLAVSYSGAPEDIARVNVSDLYDDHDIITNDKQYTYSSKTVKSKIDSLEQASTAHGSQIQKIERFTNQTNGKEGSSIAGKLDVYDDGTVIINDNTAQQVTIDSNGIKVGKLISASGSKIGDVTIDGEGLSYGTSSIKVSELASDHDLVNDAKKGNESLYTGLGNVQTLAQGLNTKTAGIVRDTTGTATTTIEGKLKVGSDGTVKINEGADQQVIIDSNGIKVGKNSSRMNDSYGFATTRDLYVGADSADAPTAAGSKFYVKGADGSIKAANGKFTVGADGDITASGLNTTTINVGANNTVNPEFTVDENGNLISRGTLSAANGQFYFGADGLKIGNGNFTVDRTSGNVVTNGSIKLNDGATTTTIKGETVTVSSSGTSKSFKLSDIADVGQNMTNLGNRIEAEETKRAQEVSRLDTAINEEKTKREQEVSRLDTAINDEKTKREQDVSRLDTAINDEKTKREQEVSRLDTAINDEKTKREQEVSRLDGKVDAVNSRVDNINADFTSRIDTVQSNVDAEKAERQADVANLGNRIDTVSNNLGDLNDLDGALKARDEYTGNSSVVGAINAEAAIRKEEVSRLDTAINDEKTKREQDVARLDGRISDISSRLNKVGAMSAAIASLKTMGYDPESPTEFSVGLGQYKGETGVALGFFHYPNKNFMINVSLSTSSGEIMGGIGATWRFGHKSPQKLLEEQRAAQAEKEIAAAEAYKAARAAKQAKNAK